MFRKLVCSLLIAGAFVATMGASAYAGGRYGARYGYVAPRGVVVTNAYRPVYRAPVYGYNYGYRPYSYGYRSYYPGYTPVYRSYGPRVGITIGIGNGGLYGYPGGFYGYPGGFGYPGYGFNAGFLPF
jgi:hypothetical protein